MNDKKKLNKRVNSILVLKVKEQIDKKCKENSKDLNKNS